MARLDNPRPRRRPARRLAAASVAAIGFLAVGLGLSTFAWSGLRQPTPTPDVAALSSRASADASRQVGSAPPATSAAPSNAPSTVPVAPSASPSLLVPSTPAPSGATIEPRPRSRISPVALRLNLQAELDRIRVRLGIPGVSVTVIFRDGSTWTGTSGRANVARRVDVEDDTAFALASVSKTYTAAEILALAGDGRIDLDAPARKYIPEAALDRRITIRQLLDHTSGLDDFFLHTPIDKALLAEPDAFWSVKRTLKYVAKPYFPPGRGWHYSNTNYLYLGLIAERVTGVPLATELRKRFFVPLSLDDTWYQAVEKPIGPLAHGYRFAGAKLTAPPIDLSTKAKVAPFTSVVTAAGGAGSIAATSYDVARWARLLYTGKVLGPVMTAEMLDGVAGTASYQPRVPYGLGVQAFPIDGRLAVGHSGRLLGFRTAMRHLPDYGVTIAVLTNQSRADPGVIVADLLSIVFTPQPTCFRCPYAE